MSRPRALVALCLLAAWAGADGHRPVSAPEQAQLLAANHAILDDLVTASVELAAAPGPLSRSEKGERVAVRLKDELCHAQAMGDADRANELFAHFRAILDGAVTPNLSQARRQIRPGSQEERRLAEMRERLTGEKDGLLKQVRDSVGGRFGPQIEQSKQGVEQAVGVK